MMKLHSLPPDADMLLSIAESVAAVLAERQEELGIATDVEALLRASIAAATLAINTYLAEAKARRDRSVEQLRRRVYPIDCTPLPPHGEKRTFWRSRASLCPSARSAH